MDVPCRSPVPAVRSAVAAAAAVAVSVLAPNAGANQPAEKPPARPIAGMSVEELAEVEVTTVSRHRESLFRTAAAVHVITSDDIRRSGATTLAEALRLAPDVQVARIDANKWAVGVRGFASRLSRGVAVMVDGRNLYSPLFAGVYWEVQDVLLEDVDRIEIVRGPGGALWGANAVAGVINVVTKSARATSGGLVEASVGTEERLLASARWSGVAGKTAYRAYAKGADREAAFHPDRDGEDGWTTIQAGARGDVDLGTSAGLTVQGDVYRAKTGLRQLVSVYTPPYRTFVEERPAQSGANVLARLTLARTATSEFSVQTYWDRTRHAEPRFTEDRDTVDVDAQYGALLGTAFRLDAGASFRWTAGDVRSVPTLVLRPAKRTDRLWGAFLQGEIWLVPDRLRATFGAKGERNDYTGFEFQPNVRVLLATGPRSTIWGAVSRAVRSPSRVESDLVGATTAVSDAAPLFVRLVGDGAFVSEKTWAFELGGRRQVSPGLFVDAAAYANRLTSLLSAEPGSVFVEPGRAVLPVTFRNGLKGWVRGVGAAFEAAVGSDVRVQAAYAYASIDLRAEAWSRDAVNGPNLEGSTPKHQASLLVSWRPARDLDLGAVVRYVDRLSTARIDDYANLDLRAAWRPIEALEIRVAGRGLFRPHTAEFGSEDSAAAEIPRAFSGGVAWRF